MPKTTAIAMGDRRKWPTLLDTDPEDRRSGGTRTPRVLLIQDSPRVAAAFMRAMRTLDVHSSWVESGSDGLAAARQQRFDLLLVDLDLPDMSGMDVIRALRAEDHTLRFMILSDTMTVSIAARTMQAGGLGVVEKPFTTADMIAVVRAALGLRSAREPAPRPVSAGLPRSAGPVAPLLAATTPGSVAERWASFIINTIDVAGDPKTVTQWAKAVGISRSVICECCRLVHVAAHDARDFARLMRAISQSGEKWQPEVVLDVADARTLRRLLAQAGLAGGAVSTPTLREFVERQQWIPKANPGLLALRSRLFGGPEPGDATR